VGANALLRDLHANPKLKDFKLPAEDPDEYTFHVPIPNQSFSLSISYSNNTGPYISVIPVKDGVVEHSAALGYEKDKWFTSAEEVAAELIRLSSLPFKEYFVKTTLVLGGAVAAKKETVNSAAAGNDCKSHQTAGRCSCTLCCAAKQMLRAGTKNGPPAMQESPKATEPKAEATASGPKAAVQESPKAIEPKAEATASVAKAAVQEPPKTIEPKAEAIASVAPAMAEGDVASYIAHARYLYASAAANPNHPIHDIGRELRSCDNKSDPAPAQVPQTAAAPTMSAADISEWEETFARVQDAKSAKNTVAPDTSAKAAVAMNRPVKTGTYPTNKSEARLTLNDEAALGSILFADSSLLWDILEMACFDNSEMEKWATANNIMLTDKMMGFAVKSTSALSAIATEPPAAAKEVSGSDKLLLHGQATALRLL
jgi:hypothetical protein